jgi:hypothetical protein
MRIAIQYVDVKNQRTIIKIQTIIIQKNLILFLQISVIDNYFIIFCKTISLYQSKIYYGNANQFHD